MKTAAVVMSMLAMIGSGALEARAAEQRTVKAISAWVGQGDLVPTGSNWIFFVGSFKGTIFVENAEGELHAARILCPGTLEVNVTSGAQRGEGRCVITRNPTDQVFARWNCAGTHGVECRGQFELTGGSGKFSRIQGKSDFKIRTGINELVLGSGAGTTREIGAGLAEWPALTYTIP
jgi:hypothetical protein